MSHFYFTHNGVPISPVYPGPLDANDFHIQYDPATGMVIDVFWTLNGNQHSPPFPAPPGANDVHFYASRLPDQVPDALKGES